MKLVESIRPPSEIDHAIYAARMKLNAMKPRPGDTHFARVAREFATTPTLAFLAFYRVYNARHRLSVGRMPQLVGNESA